VTVFAADYPFMDILWTMIIFFVWVAWIWMLIAILTDVFRRRDIGGWAKAAWTIFIVVVPFLGVLVYLIANHDGMNERSEQQAKASQAEFESYVRSVAPNGGGGAAAEIEKGKQLLDSGAITQQEFEALKVKAMA
jgi:general stress protein CsbA